MYQVLYDAMSHAGMTQVELSRELGVSQATLSRWLSGSQQPSREAAVKIATWAPSEFRAELIRDLFPEPPNDVDIKRAVIAAVDRAMGANNG